MGDRGWEYLNSSDDDFEYDKDNDGSWGYENSDGSGSFYGSDGSWGYKNSDGSGSYYGSDGSWGYRNSDGSSTYYGGDGSWGYRNSDGSGSFFGSDGSYEDIDSSSFSGDDEDDDSYDSSDISAGASLLGGLIGLGIAAYAASKSSSVDYTDTNDTYQGSSKGNIPVAKRQVLKSNSELFGKRAKAFLFKHKLIPIDYSSYSLIGKSGEEVYAILHNCGFKNVKRLVIKDIYVNSQYYDNEVEKVEINGRSQFNTNSEFPYDAQVIITIHQKKEITIPFSASSLRKLNFNEACSRLSALGFTEIYTTPIKDLVTGWITKDGSVEKVVIGSGNSETFKKNAVYKYDVSIIVHYHTFNK